MSCQPCTSCEDCREVKYVWPGCLTSSEIDTETNLPYQFSLDIPIYFVEEGVLVPVEVGEKINIRFRKIGGGEKLAVYTLAYEGIWHMDGTNGISSDDWYSDGFFNAAAGAIECEIFTDEGVPVLFISNPDGEMTDYQCTYCLLINFATGGLPISTAPFEFTCDFVRCEFTECVPGVFHLLGYVTGSDPHVDIYIKTYDEADLFNGNPPGNNVLPQQGYSYVDGCYKKLSADEYPTVIGSFGSWTVEAGIILGTV